MKIVLTNQSDNYAVLTTVVRDEPEHFIVRVPGSGGGWCRVRKDACCYVMHGTDLQEWRYGIGNPAMLVAFGGVSGLNDVERQELWNKERGIWPETYTIRTT